MRTFGVIAGVGLAAFLLIASFLLGTAPFVFVLILFGVVLYVDHRFLAAPFRDINAQIAKDPTYLDDPVRRDLCEKLLRQTSYAGPFAAREMVILRKKLHGES